jgi:hypothetical protein
MFCAGWLVDVLDHPGQPVAAVVRAARVIPRLGVMPRIKGRRARGTPDLLRLAQQYDEIQTSLRAEGVTDSKDVLRGEARARRQAIAHVARRYGIRDLDVTEALDDWALCSVANIAADLVCLKAWYRNRSGHAGKPLTRRYFRERLMPELRRGLAELDAADPAAASRPSVLGPVPLPLARRAP